MELTKNLANGYFCIEIFHPYGVAMLIAANFIVIFNANFEIIKILIFK